MARLGGGFSHWTSITAGGVTEAMISAITNDGVGAAQTAAVLDKIDGFVEEAGGTSLAHDGVFNNAYVLAATGDTSASRAHIAEFNENFIAWYGEVSIFPPRLVLAACCSAVTACMTFMVLRTTFIGGPSGPHGPVHGWGDEPGTRGWRFLPSDLCGGRQQAVSSQS
jgi:hypothetical protein